MNSISICRVPLPEVLLGAPPQRSPGPWTEEELCTFDDLPVPCWVMKPLAEPGGPRVVIYVNKACLILFGRPRTREEVEQWWNQAPEHIIGPCRAILRVVHEALQVRRETLRINLNIGRSFEQNFAECPQLLYGQLLEEAIDISTGGKVQPCSLCAMPQQVDTARLRGEALTCYSPIHSMLFSATGELLHANNSASCSIFGTTAGRQTGLDPCNPLRLEQLLSINGELGHKLEILQRLKIHIACFSQGHPQPEIAREAIEAMVNQRAGHFEVTLTSQRSNGKPRHTLFEFWPAQDPADSMHNVAFMVSSFDVTRLKEQELQLRSMELVLQRRNADLQEQVDSVKSRAASLDEERKQLRSRLQEALQLHKLPHVAVSTTSSIDMTVDLLDQLLEGEVPKVEQILKLRNDLLQSADLRAPQNLAQQIAGQKGLTEEAGRNLASLFQDDTAATLLEPVTARSRLLSRTSSSSPLVSFRDGLAQRRFSGTRVSADIPQVPWLVRDESEASTEHLAWPMHSVTPDIDRLLMEAQTCWDFDMFKLEDATRGHPLSCLAYFIFQTTGLAEHFQLPDHTLLCFLWEIESGYRDNPYHNRTHAACVLHLAYHLTHCQGGLRSLGIVEEVMEAALYIAAVCHDFDHPGLTNDFLIRSHDLLAITYNDKSPLENHHAAGSFRVFYKHFSNSEKQPSEILDQAGRAAIIELILSTDMKQHFSLMSRLQGAFQLGVYAQSKEARERKLDGSGELVHDASQQAPPLSAEHRLLAVQCALKAADVGHLALPHDLHQIWTGRLQEEWFRQGDRERKASMPISALMDREKPGNIASNQVGFFEVVAMPMFTCLSAVLPGALPLQAGAADNARAWMLQLAS